MYGVLGGRGGGGEQSSGPSRKARSHMYWQQSASSDISDAMRLEEPRKRTTGVVKKETPPRVYHLKRGLI